MLQTVKRMLHLANNVLKKPNYHQKEVKTAGCLYSDTTSKLSATP